MANVCDSTILQRFGDAPERPVPLLGCRMCLNGAASSLSECGLGSASHTKISQLPNETGFGGSRCSLCLTQRGGLLADCPVYRG